MLDANKRKILIVQDMPTLYTNLLFSSFLHFSEYKEFVELQKKIFKNLKNEIRTNVVIRLGSANNFHIYTFGGLKETNKWLTENNYA